MLTGVFRLDFVVLLFFFSLMPPRFESVRAYVMNQKEKTKQTTRGQNSNERQTLDLYTYTCLYTYNSLKTVNVINTI